MAKNPILEDSVLQVMAEQAAQRDSRLKTFSEGNTEKIKGLILKVGEIRIDELHRLRIHFGNYIGYGYDFNEANLGRSAREMYENATKYTRKNPCGNAGEQLIHDEIKEDRFGVYITSLG